MMNPDGCVNVCMSSWRAGHHFVGKPPAISVCVFVNVWLCECVNADVCCKAVIKVGVKLYI